MSNHSKENNKNITNIPQNIQNPLQKIFETKTPTKPYFTMNGSNKKNVYQNKKISNIPSTFPPKGLKYRTELCKNFEISGTCKYGNKCDYAHGSQDLRQRNQSNHSFKLKKCKSFFSNGYCPYGIRCQFSQSILPNLSYNDLIFLFSLFGVDENKNKNRLSVFREISNLM